MYHVSNRAKAADSAVVEPVSAVNNGSSVERLGGRIPRWIAHDVPKRDMFSAAAIYLLFTFAIYWPVFFGDRFFWEDFAIQGYPFRDFSSYMVRVCHALPFWDPYNWFYAPFLSDAQTAFWYPGNLLQIAVHQIFFTTSDHLPVIIPEAVTLLHLPIAALGLFLLLRRRFGLSYGSAIIAGFTFGFGLRIVSDQNHTMFVYQLALLPWETLLVIASWQSVRAIAGLGLLLGISFFAGQPQVFLFISIFLVLFSVAESIARSREKKGWGYRLRPISAFSIAFILSIGIASIQLLPSSELASQTDRSALSYSQASEFALNPAGFVGFIVPRYFPEGSGVPFFEVLPMQPTFYWSLLGEFLALFAVARLWILRDQHTAWTRYYWFFLLFWIFALAFALGRYLPIQWLFWKFVPEFNRVRAPARMLWCAWFIGSVFTGIGLELLLQHSTALRSTSKLLRWFQIIILSVSAVAVSGVADRLILKNHHIRAEWMQHLAPAFIIALFVSIFLFIVSRRQLSRRTLLWFAAILIVGDLYYYDSTQDVSPANLDSGVVQESKSPALLALASEFSAGHSKLLRPDHRSIIPANLGTILRLPIEDAIDTTLADQLNPLHLTGMFPPIADSIRRMQCMGISGVISSSARTARYRDPLPFIALYHSWMLKTLRLFNDTSLDITKTVLLDSPPLPPPGAPHPGDTAILQNFSENQLQVAVRSSSPCILLINDLYYPDWEATIDGKPLTIVRAFTSLRAVALPGGQHYIEMRYESASFNLGWKITIGTIIASLLALAIGKKKQKNPATRGPSELK